jgi:hypothetical protein
VIVGASESKRAFVCTGGVIRVCARVRDRVRMHWQQTVPHVGEHVQ